MARLVPLAFALALACAPHVPPPQDEVLLRRPLALLPIDADCGGALARLADAAVAAGLGRDEQWLDGAHLPPEHEVFPTGPSRQVLFDLVAARPDLAAPAERRYGYEQDLARDGAPRWRVHCMHADGPALRALAGATIVDDPPGNPAVRLDMLAGDAKAFHALTERHLERRIAVVDLDEVLTAPVVKMPIPGGSVRIDLGADEREPRVAAAALLTRLLGR